MVRCFLCPALDISGPLVTPGLTCWQQCSRFAGDLFRFGQEIHTIIALTDDWRVTQYHRTGDTIVNANSRVKLFACVRVSAECYVFCGYVFCGYVGLLHVSVSSLSPASPVPLFV